ncbi:hypothetical protein D3C87_1976980 [compost metagenome]
MKQPYELLSEVAPNVPVKNVTARVVVDNGRYWGATLLTFAAGMAITAFAPENVKGFGGLVPLVMLLIPQSRTLEIEGDFTELPKDLGKGK